MYCVCVAGGVRGRGDVLGCGIRVLFVVCVGDGVRAKKTYCSVPGVCVECVAGVITGKKCTVVCCFSLPSSLCVLCVAVFCAALLDSSISGTLELWN